MKSLLKPVSPPVTHESMCNCIESESNEHVFMLLLMLLKEKFLGLSNFDGKKIRVTKFLFGDKNFESTFGQAEAQIYSVIQS